jgi:hypothetical protein
MRAMVVEVRPEIEQLVFEIYRRPEQGVIQILASKGADYPFHEWMGQWNVGDGLDSGIMSSLWNKGAEMKSWGAGIGAFIRRSMLLLIARDIVTFEKS